MIQKILNDIQTAEALEERSNVTGDGITGWRSSGLGTCMRGRFLNRLLSGTGIKPEMDPRVLRVFEVGNQIEDWLMAKLVKQTDYTVYQQVAMEDKEFNLTGHLDALLVSNKDDTEYIVECKSRQSRSFWYMAGTKTRAGTGASIHHKMQLHSYLYMLNKYGGTLTDGTKLPPRSSLKEGCVFYVSKDDMSILEYPVFLGDKDLEEMWKSELRALNTAWDTQTAPPAPDKGSWQEKYCDFCKAGLCGDLDDAKVKELFAVKATQVSPAITPAMDGTATVPAEQVQSVNTQAQKQVTKTTPASNEPPAGSRRAKYQVQKSTKPSYDPKDEIIIVKERTYHGTVKTTKTYPDGTVEVTEEPVRGY